MTDDDKALLGERLRAERKARIGSQVKLAARLLEVTGRSYTLDSVVRQIRRWESGAVCPRDWRGAYARALRTSEADLFGDQTPLIEPSAVLAAPDGADVEVKAGDADVIRDMLRALTAADRQFGGAHARQQAGDFYAEIVQPRLYARTNLRTHRELCSVATEFALRVSAMNLDASRVRASRGFLGAAVGASHETDSPALTAWVLARRGEQEIDEQGMSTALDDPDAVERALSYTAGAVAMSERAAPLARAFILTKRALALSCAGDEAGTLGVLGQMWDAFDRAGAVDEPEWMQAYGWGHLRHEEARCLANLRLGQRAVEASEESMQVRKNPKPWAFSLAVQAIGHVHAGELDHACGVAAELVDLASRLDSHRVRARVMDVATALRPHRMLPAVRDVQDSARTLLADARG